VPRNVGDQQPPLPVAGDKEVIEIAGTGVTGTYRATMRMSADSERAPGRSESWMRRASSNLRWISPSSTSRSSVRHAARARCYLSWLRDHSHNARSSVRSGVGPGSSLCGLTMLLSDRRLQKARYSS